MFIIFFNISFNIFCQNNVFEKKELNFTFEIPNNWSIISDEVLNKTYGDGSAFVGGIENINNKVYLLIENRDKNMSYTEYIKTYKYFGNIELIENNKTRKYDFTKLPFNGYNFKDDKNKIIIYGQENNANSDILLTIVVTFYGKEKKVKFYFFIVKGFEEASQKDIYQIVKSFKFNKGYEE